MLEQIFRNINDIRVFDAIYCSFPDISCDINDIMNVMESKDIEYIQIEDSLEHLVRQKILEKYPKDTESYTGCRTCFYMDKLHIPRTREHKNHIPFSKNTIQITNYIITSNDINKHLYSALFEHIKLTSEEL